MRKLSVVLFALLFSTLAHAWSGTLAAPTTCADVDHGTWVTTYTGNATVIYSGTFNGGTASLYQMNTSGVGDLVPSSSATDGTTTPFPVSLAGGAQLCVGATAATAIHWEINPDMVKFPGSGELVPRYFIPDADYASGVGQDE